MRTLLSVDVYGSGEEYPEAEPVVIETEGPAVTLTLDDGMRIVADRGELIRAVVAGRGELAA